MNQYFEFQEIAEDQKVRWASFHLEGEANQWWQWLRKALDEEQRTMTWEAFEYELRARFGPSDAEDFDGTLSRVKQIMTLRDYQQEFERLGNRVRGWTQKVLVGTLMGDLKPEIADGIRMFKPRLIKEAISLARMRDDHIIRQRRFLQPSTTRTPLTVANPVPPVAPTQALVKRLSWDEIQKRRAQGLCFNCKERFTLRHKCQEPQLLILEGYTPHDGNICVAYTKEPTSSEEVEVIKEPEITLHALTGWTVPRTMHINAKLGSYKDACTTIS